MKCEIEKAKEHLGGLKETVQKSIFLLEENKNAREIKRKEILLKEMKIILSKLSYNETKVISETKSAAFDVLVMVSRLEDEAKAMEAYLGDAPDDNRSWRSEVNSLLRKIQEQRFDEFVKTLQLSVGSVPSGSLNQVHDLMSDSVYLQTPSFSPKSFSLRIPESNPNFDRSGSEYYPHYFEVQVLSNVDDLGFPPFLLKRMSITMTCPQSQTELLDDTVWSKVENKRAKVSDTGKCVNIWIKRPKNMMCAISVKLLCSNIHQSPQVQHFLDEFSPYQITQNLTMANETGIDVFDTSRVISHNGVANAINHELDQSDLNSLDMTTRAKMQMMMNPQLILSNSVSASPGYHPIRRASGENNMFRGNGIPQLQHPPGPPLSSSTALPQPTSLPHPTDTSPFRPGLGQISTLKPMAASQLSEALTLSDADVDVHELEEIQQNADYEANEVSLLDPGKRSQLSVDDAQKSLSSDEAGESFVNVDSRLERSVSFAARHQVVSVLSTPQVPSGGGRFVVADGDTKELDGEAGVQNVRRLSQVSATRMNQESLKEMEVCEQEEDNEADKTAPLPDDDEEHGFVIDNGDIDVDPLWSEEVDSAPIVYPSQPNTLNHSMWSVNSSFNGETVDFLRLKFEKVANFGPMEISVRGRSLQALVTPHDIAYVSKSNIFLVTETFRDRVGVYDGSTFAFKSWLQHPKSRSFTKPSCVLATANGFVFILEQRKLQIFDAHMMPFMFKFGYYYGLTEGLNGDVYTIVSIRDQGRHQGHFVQRFSVGPNGFYNYNGQIKLKVIDPIPRSQNPSNPRFLTYHYGKIFVTDLGLHKIYMVDLETEDQVPIGYFGSKSGQFSKPTGIVSDEHGNILLADRDNKRLMLFNQNLQFVKNVEVPGFDCPDGVQSIRRYQDTIYVVNRGTKDRPGGITQLKVEMI